MIRQYFDREAFSYTYLLVDPLGQQAAIIDPVLEQIDQYIQQFDELGIELVAALDTHVHADHVTALGMLGKKTSAKMYLGNDGKVSCADFSLQNIESVKVGGQTLSVIATILNFLRSSLRTLFSDRLICFVEQRHPCKCL